MIREFTEELREQELTAALGRSKSEWPAGEPRGYRNSTRERKLLGSFGPIKVEVLRARMAAADGGTKEWRSTVLPRYARMWLNDGSCVRLRPEKPNHAWGYHLVKDRTQDGRKLRMLDVVDEFTHECLCIRVGRKLNLSDVLTDPIISSPVTMLH